MDSHPDCAQGDGRSICGVMMFEGDNALKKVSVLSGGEKSRVLLGKLLVSPANLLMLDEPTNHLDMESIDSLIEAIEVFDGAVIIVTHSELMLDALATRLIVYDNDTVSASLKGPISDFLERVGWSDEGGVKVKKGKKQNGDQNANRRDTKKQRTAIISERSRALSSLKKKITTLEEEITRLEYDVEQDTQRLLEVTVKGEALNIKKLSQAIGENKARIDSRFAELQTATNEHDEKAKVFDQQLAELAEMT